MLGIPVSVKFLVHKLRRFVVDQEIIALIPFSFFAVVVFFVGRFWSCAYFLEI